MERRNGSWVMAVGLVMLAYGGAVVWSLFVPRVDVIARVDRLVLALLIAGVGAYALARESIREPEDATPSLLAQAVESFLAAWSLLWRTKWLLWVYGFIAALVAVSNAAFSFLTYRHFQGETDGLAGVSAVLFPLFKVSDWVQNSLQGASGRFVPAIHVFFGVPLYTLVVFALAWWALPRVARLSQNPECQGGARAFSICAVVAALSGIWVVVLWMMSVRWLWIPAGASRALGNETQRLWPYVTVVMMVEIVIVNAAVIGGVIGSLARNSRGEQNVKTTFLADAVRYFVPLALFYLAVDSAFLIPAIIMNAVTGRILTGTANTVFYSAVFLQGIMTLAYLLLMFAPFGIVTRGQGMVEAMAHSIDVWKRMWKNTGAIVAVGAFVSGFVMLLVNLSSFFYSPKASLWSIPLVVVHLIVETLVGVIILLAIWEFYQANAIDRELVSAVESGPLP